MGPRLLRALLSTALSLAHLQDSPDAPIADACYRRRPLMFTVESYGIYINIDKNKN